MKISAVALIKMTMHAKRGGNLEVLYFLRQLGYCNSKCSGYGSDARTCGRAHVRGHRQFCAAGGGHGDEGQCAGAGTVAGGTVVVQDRVRTGRICVWDVL